MTDFINMLIWLAACWLILGWLMDAMNEDVR